jgi:hypothetical protein
VKKVVFNPITGKIDYIDQEDLSGYVNHGADGEGTEDLDYVQLNDDYTATGTEPIGRIYWNKDDQTADVRLTDDVTGQLFQEMFYDGINQTGSLIPDGTPVMFAGALGASGKVKIQPAIADGSLNSSWIMGITTEAMPNGELGKITVFGKLRGIQTNGANFGETWVDGDIIYVGTTAGTLTNVQPQAPNQNIEVAAVITAHATMGTLLVRPTWRSKINELSDVDGTAHDTTGQILVYDQVRKVWDADYNINNYLKLDQTTPQTLTGGIPKLESTRVIDENNELVDKIYVDTAVSSLGMRFYALDDVDAGTGYYLTSMIASTDATVTISASGVVDNQLLGSWISPANGFTKLLAGLYDFQMYAARTSGTRDFRIYWELIEYKADTTEVVIATSPSSNAITDKRKVDIFVTLTTDYVLTAGSRIVGKIYADIGTSGSAPNTALYIEGDEDSHWEIPTDTEILDTLYVKQDGTTPLTADWDAGDYEIRAKTFESDVATGTAPLVVASTTAVTNLNADKVDGYDLNQALLTTSSPSFVSITESTPTLLKLDQTTPQTLTTSPIFDNLTAGRILQASATKTIESSSLIKSGAGILTLSAVSAYQLDANASGGVLVRAAGTPLTAGRVLFATDANTAGDDAGLAWDNVSKCLRVAGPNFPVMRLDRQTTVSASRVTFDLLHSTTAVLTTAHASGMTFSVQGSGMAAPETIAVITGRYVSAGTGRVEISPYNGGDVATARLFVLNTGSVIIGLTTTTDGMTAGGSLAVAKDLRLDSLTATRIPFLNSSKILTDSASLAWNDTNNRLELGGASSSTLPRLFVTSSAARVIMARRALTSAASGATYGAITLELTNSGTKRPCATAHFFMLPNENGDSTFAGMLGGGLTNIISGTEVGEMSLNPSYAGADPGGSALTPGLRVRAIAADTTQTLIAGNTLIGTTTDGMTAGGSLAIAQDLAHRGTKVGFNNATPITKPTVTGSRGANAALASLLTALANFGLITDSSS